MPVETWVPKAQGYSSATLHEAAGQRGALPSAIKPLEPDWKVCGRAVPVSSPPGDNLWLHRAIYAAQPGDILVVHTGGAYEYGYWGDVMTTAALARGLGGLVIDGCVRDGKVLRELGFPIFARGLCIRGTRKDPSGAGSIRLPIRIDDAVVQDGDLVVGDADGVVVVPQADVEATLVRAQQRERHEEEVRVLLRRGASTLDIYHFPAAPPE
ncbi:4-carboxy-4-hydroxy-2-oxoadipate aldolase/oxaloacetate decarboxylase [Alicyclobacillus shizuokensis]|uniref:4-carboxy-4-hydroxy-2-oxoadipate aldolase/oxaloacetate decarboxylase n=1 Tax=Alicyclobacillus shizuokensis TaxID=392014 RepID=UPI00082DB1C0|nr:4-carboxy-4-hydroxy-2-oxoadipate aldolase/oxaloacetate decarboxylase [Alicyclobacillus shizuokensis]